VEHISIYLSQLDFTSKEDYMRVQNFPLSLTGIAFAWLTSLPQCTVGSWSQLEEKFYEYFEKTNEKRSIIIESSAKRGLLVGMKERIDLAICKGSATKAKQHNILSEAITYQEISPATEKYGKRQKPARLDFSGAKGVIHLSCYCRIIDRDQAPTSNKEGLPAYSELTEPTLKSTKLTPICSKLAKPTVQSARPTAYATCPESARPTSKLAKPTTPAAIVTASAQVGLADSQSARPTFLVPAAADASSGGLTPLVDWFLEKKSNIMQIKDIHFSNMINKV
jgi:hypothetical protein